MITKEENKNLLQELDIDLTDEEAELIVLKTNLRQRSFSEFMLSEKVFIVATYYNTLKKQGKRNDLLNQLSNNLKSLLDTEQLKLVSGVAISFLSKQQQQEVYDYITSYNINPSTAQSEELKKISQNGDWKSGTIAGSTIYAVFYETENKPVKNNVRVKYSKIKEFLPTNVSETEAIEIIVEALEFYKSKYNYF